MNENTINNDVTMNGASATVLVNRYRVIRQLGQGGMGSVWLAEDTQLDNRPVAIKMLPSILVSNKRAYNQLKAEALVSLKLTHPNIATVRAFEENNGNPFLVIDYIDGLTLDEYLAKKGNLDEESTCCILEPIAAALDYAHAHGVVHRDVKPGNVMVTWDGDPYILDFGIAREIQETMTRVTGRMSSGTLPYMSPEQLNGAAPKPAQDIYSFAALVYECLTGRPPFSRGQIEFQIEHDMPEALPMSIGIGASVMAGLAKTASSRPATCAEVLSRIGHQASSPSIQRAHPTHPRMTFRRVRSVPWYARITWQPVYLPLLALVLSAVLAICAHSVQSQRRSVRRNARTSALQAECARDESEALEVARGGARRLEEELKRKTDEEIKRILEQEARNAGRKRVEAKLKELSADAEQDLEKCRKLDQSDGVGRYVEVTERLFSDAQARERSNCWGKASAAYSNVVSRCEMIQLLAKYRDQAKDIRTEMENVRKEAKKVCGQPELEAADKIRSQGEEAFASLRFGKAAKMFVSATEAYDKAMSARLSDNAAAERRAADRKRREEEARRKHEIEIEAYRRKYYPEFYEKSPLSDLEPIYYWKEEKTPPNKNRFRNR